MCHTLYCIVSHCGKSYFRMTICLLVIQSEIQCLSRVVVLFSFSFFTSVVKCFHFYLRTELLPRLVLDHPSIKSTIETLTVYLEVMLTLLNVIIIIICFGFQFVR